MTDRRLYSIRALLIHVVLREEGGGGGGGVFLPVSTCGTERERRGKEGRSARVKVANTSLDSTLHYSRDTVLLKGTLNKMYETLNKM